MNEGSNPKTINFGSGPAALPREVLAALAEAVREYKGSGLSVLEIPHRGSLFQDILDESRSLVTELCGLGSDYEVLWLHGGGRLQFCMIPQNFLDAGAPAGYIDSGYWSAEAVRYANYFGETLTLASGREWAYRRLPPLPAEIPEKLAYLHYTTNNTIYGTQWRAAPGNGAPLIADMSSDILSCSREYRQYALYYATAQKNLGTAGTTLAVIHRDMLTRVRRKLPPMLSYAAHVEARSVLNTPPVFAIYSALLMLRWTKAQTIAHLEEQNERKAALLYSELERSSLFEPSVPIPEHRSRMNICFLGKNEQIAKGFSDFCTRNGITGIEGHRAVAGFRASLYNAITEAQVRKLVTVMQEYEHIVSKTSPE